jgi:hypothetical protein
LSEKGAWSAQNLDIAVYQHLEAGFSWSYILWTVLLCIVLLSGKCRNFRSRAFCLDANLAFIINIINVSHQPYLAFSGSEGSSRPIVGVKSEYSLAVAAFGLQLFSSSITSEALACRLEDLSVSANLRIMHDDLASRSARHRFRLRRTAIQKFRCQGEMLLNSLPSKFSYGDHLQDRRTLCLAELLVKHDHDDDSNDTDFDKDFNDEDIHGDKTMRKRSTTKT